MPAITSLVSHHQRPHRTRRAPQCRVLVAGDDVEERPEAGVASAVAAFPAHGEGKGPPPRSPATAFRWWEFIPGTLGGYDTPGSSNSRTFCGIEDGAA